MIFLAIFLDIGNPPMPATDDAAAVVAAFWLVSFFIVLWAVTIVGRKLKRAWKYYTGKK